MSKSDDREIVDDEVIEAARDLVKIIMDYNNPPPDILVGAERLSAALDDFEARQ